MLTLLILHDYFANVRLRESTSPQEIAMLRFLNLTHGAHESGDLNFIAIFYQCDELI